jgi:hypothetical protein
MNVDGAGIAHLMSRSSQTLPYVVYPWIEHLLIKRHCKRRVSKDIDMITVALLMCDPAIE